MILNDAFMRTMEKVSAELTAESRAQIAKKNFALTPKQSKTGKGAYPIHDERHARAALGFVGMHGSDQEKHEVYKDIARKYPHIAAKSSIPALKGMVKGSSEGFEELLAKLSARLFKEKDANMGMPMGGPANMKTLPGVINNTAPSLTPPMAGPPKMASVAGAVGERLGTSSGALKAMGKHLSEHGNAYDLAGLGLLAAPSAVGMAHQARNKMRGQGVDKKELAHGAAELGGLGLIAAPVAASLLSGRGH